MKLVLVGPDSSIKTTEPDWVCVPCLENPDHIDSYIEQCVDCWLYTPHVTHYASVIPCPSDRLGFRCLEHRGGEFVEPTDEGDGYMSETLECTVGRELIERWKKAKQ